MQIALPGLALLSVLATACGHPSPDGLSAPDTPDPPFPVPDPLTVLVTGDHYNWHLRYPGRDGVLRTEDDVHAMRHLHAPVGVRLELELASRDLLYTLAFPHVGQKEIAVPDLTFHLKFDTPEAGVFEMRGDQFCGYSHPDLVGTLVVESPEEFQAWLARNETRR